MSKRNLELLVEASRLLKPLLGELVFVGGSTTALLITDKAAAEVRPTYDVDAIAEISSYAAYADFSDRLRRCGFTEDTGEGAPICRWRQKKTILDVMPLDEKILGFSNRWYKPAMDSAVIHDLGPDLRVRVVTAVYFCATKLEAFAGRGKYDYQSSHDLEDLMAVVDGRAELAGETTLGWRTFAHTLLQNSRSCLPLRSFLMHYPATCSPTKRARLASRYCLSDCKRWRPFSRRVSPGFGHIVGTLIPENTGSGALDG